MPRVVRHGQRKSGHVDIAYSDCSQASDKSQKALPITEDSYCGAPVAGLENSQASLNKRIASVAGLDDAAPKSFDFLFEAAQAKTRGFSVDGGGSCGAKGVLDGTPALAFHSQERERSVGVSRDFPALQTAPVSFEDGDFQWVRTEIKKGADLVDGQAWISEYQRRVGASKSLTHDKTYPEDGHGGSQCSDMLIRNRVLREMGSVVPPGKKVRLSTGQDVIFWFNVGAPGPPRARVQVTDARCPHQGVCLLKGELMEIEDAAGMRHAMSRCPRHNKTFNLRTGASHGNVETLKVFPCRFEHGYWYVGVNLAGELGTAREEARAVPNIAAVVASLVEPDTVRKLPISEEPREVASAHKRRRAANGKSEEAARLNE